MIKLLKTEIRNYIISFKSLMTHSFSGSFANLTEFTRFIIYIFIINLLYRKKKKKISQMFYAVLVLVADKNFIYCSIAKSLQL